MHFKNRKPSNKQPYEMTCAKCKATITVDLGKVKKGYKAICRKCGAEYPFSESDERLVRKFSKPI
ncbi:MAG: hypothetical protein AB7E76_13285 [Deferribacterales bacterium]